MSSTSWKLRPAELSDASRVASLFTLSFAVLDFLPKLHTPEENQVFFAEVVAEEFVTVADEDGEILGFVGETQSWVNHLYVHPNHLRRGIGSALLQISQGHQERLQLRCFQKNARGRAFYEAHGFVATEFTDGLNNEEKEPDILYEWRRPLT